MIGPALEKIIDLLNSESRFPKYEERLDKWIETTPFSDVVQVLAFLEGMREARGSGLLGGNGVSERMLGRVIFLPAGETKNEWITRNLRPDGTLLLPAAPTKVPDEFDA